MLDGVDEYVALGGRWQGNMHYDTTICDVFLVGESNGIPSSTK